MVYSGIHKKFESFHYSAEEEKIINRISRNWYVTSSTPPLSLSFTSVYRAFLGRASERFAESFNLEREIIFSFSSYEKFEVRTLDGFEEAALRWEPLRTDPICRVLISKDPNVEEKVSNILKNDPEYPIVIPLTYEELLNGDVDTILKNRFRKHFFSRDLFAFESPLKKDLYFFGRNGLVNHLLSRHRSSENSALFGLRRSGKTSIVYGLERATKLSKGTFAFIDCQNPSVHQRRWNQVLFYIIKKISEQYNVSIKKIDEKSYSELDASDCFFRDIKYIKGKIGSPILIVFDEIERITFGTSSSSHWSEDSDFVLFWQAIRSAFQRHDGVFSFVLIGTNASCVEAAQVNGQDNPIFNSVPVTYIEGFSVDDTREMVRKLGRYMGLRFEEGLYARLNDDFGGHPYLIRHICSIIHSKCNSHRPVVVDKSLYEVAKEEFKEKYSSYTEMILDVLKTDYPDEYEMISALSRGDKEFFDGFSEDRTLLNHLLGYGLLQKGSHGYFFKIEAVKEHLQNRQKYQKINMSEPEMLAEIAERRSQIEPSLRRLVSTVILSSYGKNSMNKIEPYLGAMAKRYAKQKSFKELFYPSSIDTNFSDLVKIIEGEWGKFENFFDLDLSEFRFHAEQIRKARTQEAHSGQLAREQFLQARLSFEKLESNLFE